MSEDPKTASGLIVKEVADVVPETEKRVAGRALGEAIANTAEALRDVTALVRVVASVPREAAGFVGRVYRRWRRLPKERRGALPPLLLLEAATGYAGTTDPELRASFERLLENATDSRTAALFHPSFVSSLKQMSGADARFMRLMGTGAKFHSIDSLYQALGVSPDVPMIVTTTMLNKLGYITTIGPAGVSGEEPAITPLPGQIFVYRPDHSGHDPDPRGWPMYRTIFMATPVGRAFLAAVGAYAGEHDAPVWV